MAVIQAFFPGSRLSPELLLRVSDAVDSSLPSFRNTLRLPPGLVRPMPWNAGQPLPILVQRRMESLFRADFSQVRIHIGPEAPSIGARAFTMGTSIYFAREHYEPFSRTGQELLAHELTHVLQQRAGRVHNPHGDAMAVVHDPELEAEAQRIAAQIAIGLPLMQTSGAPHPAALPRGASAGTPSLGTIQCDDSSDEESDDGQPKKKRKLGKGGSQITRQGGSDSEEEERERKRKRRTSVVGFTFFKKAPTPSSPKRWTNSDVEPDSSSSSDDEEWSKQLKKRFLRNFGKHLQDKKLAYGKKYKNNKELYKQKSQDARDLTRLAWVLEKLNPKRVCVAVLVAEGEIYIYANVIDTEGIHTDMRSLLKAIDDDEKRASLITIIANSLKGEIRVKTSQKTIPAYLKKVEQKRKLARRRVIKALRLLQLLQHHGQGKVQWQVHIPKTGDKHAEMRASDAALAKRGFIGISKLCCGKCFLGLLAAKALGLDFDAQGAHFKTYDSSTGWPVPNFLVMNKDAMEAFLGKDAYAIYQEYPVECLTLIKEEKLDSKAFAATDMVSSEEEIDSDEEYEFFEDLSKLSLKGKVHKAKTLLRGNSLELLTTLGMTRHDQPGEGMNCAIFSILDQLKRRYGISVSNPNRFANRVRERADFPLDQMIDVLNHGQELLKAIQDLMRELSNGAVDLRLTLDIWAATIEGTVMEYQNVARGPGGGTDRIVTLYYNGIDHFDSLTGDITRKSDK